MRHGSINPTILSEQSPLPLLYSSGKRHRRRRYEGCKKRHKLLSLEIKAQFQIQSLQYDPFQKFGSYSNRRAISCDVGCMQDRNDEKLGKTFDHRKWTYSTHDTSKFSKKFILVSYNILAVENVAKHPQLYRYVSPKYLDWEQRKKLLWNEVKSYLPSIICFQEVDRFDDLKGLFGKNGFKGVYKVRTGEACDGCAIFWKTEQFILLHEESIEFQTHGLGNNVAQFCILKMNQNCPSIFYATTEKSASARASPSLLIGNIHVLYNPKRGDIKLGQMRIFLQKAYELSREWGNIPVVIAGDLNSLPQSAMYQFLASSELHIQQLDRRNISGQVGRSQYAESQSWRNHAPRWTDEELILATGSIQGFLRHPLKLTSTYTEIPGTPKYRDKVGEPLATSYHCMFNGTVDYIWHGSGLTPVKVLETLSTHTLRSIGGLPSKRWGSDHLALVCELAFADDDN